MSEISDKLVSGWRLSESSGTRRDALGQHHLSDMNTVLSTPGFLLDGALFAAANDEYLEAASTSDLQIGDGSFTLFAWVKLTTAGALQTIASKYNALTDGEYIFRVSASDELQIVISDGAANTTHTFTGKTLTAGRWHFVCARYDQTDLYLRVDGSADETLSYSTGSASTSAPFRLGIQATSSNPLDGAISLVGFAKQFLPDADIDSIYNNGRGLDIPFDPNKSDTEDDTPYTKASSVEGLDLIKVVACQLHNLQAHYSAKALVGSLSDGAAVASLPDVTGNGNDGSQATPANQPIFVTDGINGLPSLYFEATKRLLISSLAAAMTGTDKECTVAVVLQNASPSEGTDFLTFGNAAGDTATRHLLFASTGGGAYRIRKRDDADLAANVDVGAVDADPHVVVMRIQGTTGSVFVDGTQVGVDTVIDVGALTLDLGAIGARIAGATPDFSNHFNGWLGDLMVWDTALSDVGVTSISRTLGSLYDITVA